MRNRYRIRTSVHCHRLSPYQWTNAQIDLVIAGLIEKIGEKRGTRDRIKEAE